MAQDSDELSDKRITTGYGAPGCWGGRGRGRGVSHEEAGPERERSDDRVVDGKNRTERSIVDGGSGVNRKEGARVCTCMSVRVYVYTCTCKKGEYGGGEVLLSPCVRV